MKRMISAFLCTAVILSVSIFTSGCGSSVPVPSAGKYLSARGGDSYIILSDYKTGNNSNLGDQYIGECCLQFFNIDLSYYADFCTNMTVANNIILYYDDLSGEEYNAKYDELFQEFSKNIDLRSQYSDNKSIFYYGHLPEYKKYWFSSEIAGSGFDGKYEGYLNVEYLPDEKAIICDEIKYVLEE